MSVEMASWLEVWMAESGASRPVGPNGEPVEPAQGSLLHMDTSTVLQEVERRRETDCKALMEALESLAYVAVAASEAAAVLPDLALIQTDGDFMRGMPKVGDSVVAAVDCVEYGPGLVRELRGDGALEVSFGLSEAEAWPVSSLRLSRSERRSVKRELGEAQAMLGIRHMSVAGKLFGERLLSVGLGVTVWWVEPDIVGALKGMELLDSLSCGTVVGMSLYNSAFYVRPHKGSHKVRLVPVELVVELRETQEGGPKSLHGLLTSGGKRARQSTQLFASPALTAHADTGPHPPIRSSSRQSQDSRSSDKSTEKKAKKPKAAKADGKPPKVDKAVAKALAAAKAAEDTSEALLKANEAHGPAKPSISSRSGRMEQHLDLSENAVQELLDTVHRMDIKLEEMHGQQTNGQGDAASTGASTTAELEEKLKQVGEEVLHKLTGSLSDNVAKLVDGAIQDLRSAIKEEVRKSVVTLADEVGSHAAQMCVSLISASENAATAVRAIIDDQRGDFPKPPTMPEPYDPPAGEETGEGPRKALPNVRLMKLGANYVVEGGERDGDGFVVPGVPQPVPAPKRPSSSTSSTGSPIPPTKKAKPSAKANVSKKLGQGLFPENWAEGELPLRQALEEHHKGVLPPFVANYSLPALVQVLAKQPMVKLDDELGVYKRMNHILSIWTLQSDPMMLIIEFQKVHAPLTHLYYAWRYAWREGQEAEDVLGMWFRHGFRVATKYKAATWEELIDALPVSWRDESGADDTVASLIPEQFLAWYGLFKTLTYSHPDIGTRGKDYDTTVLRKALADCRAYWVKNQTKARSGGKASDNKPPKSASKKKATSIKSGSDEDEEEPEPKTD